MSAPPFRLNLTGPVSKSIDKIKKTNQAKAKKVQNTLAILRERGPRYPGLNSHPYHSEIAGYTNVWESYVENRTPGAWRMWWMYGPDPDTLTIIAVGEHP